MSSPVWTGPPPETPYSGSNRSFRPRWDPVERRTTTVAGWLWGACFLAFLIWYVVLGSRSTVVPSPETGHTEALKVFPGRGRPIFVKPAELLITYALLVAAFAFPMAYLGWNALCRRFKR